MDYIRGTVRNQVILFPEAVEDYISPRIIRSASLMLSFMRQSADLSLAGSHVTFRGPWTPD
jgi:hypothetical protein